MRKMIVLKLLLLGLPLYSPAQSSTFTVVPLGIKGGIDESNLSAYALAATGTDEYICLDAGTLNFGIQKAIGKKVWQGDATEILRTRIKGYLISHPHLDHVSGLILNSPDDSSKPIYATESCLSVLKEKYFSWKSWANFGNEGEKPTLNKYTYTTLVPGNELSLQGTSLSVTPFLLSHSNPGESTAFLVRYRDTYILYLGDTGADEIEKSDRLLRLWKAVAPTVKSGKLKALFIEVSFANEHPKNLLFGHLTPQLLMNEMIRLGKLTGADALKNLPVVITHRKPFGNREEIIYKQLTESDTLGLKLIFPEQGGRLDF